MLILNIDFLEENGLRWIYNNIFYAKLLTYPMRNSGYIYIFLKILM